MGIAYLGTYLPSLCLFVFASRHAPGVPSRLQTSYRISQAAGTAAAPLVVFRQLAHRELRVQQTFGVQTYQITLVAAG